MSVSAWKIDEKRLEEIRICVERDEELVVPIDYARDLLALLDAMRVRAEDAEAKLAALREAIERVLSQPNPDQVADNPDAAARETAFQEIEEADLALSRALADAREELP